VEFQGEYRSEVHAIRRTAGLAGSYELGSSVFVLGAKTQFRRQRALRDQIERAALSVANNIAEGFERGTTQELITFLYIARGSAGEVRSMCCLIEPLMDCPI
jgi:four helix bundle protein